MNLGILHELINRYENHLDMLYDEEHNELFKWKALKTWQDEWFRPAADFASFADRFNAARKDFSLFIDNSQMHPSTGILKLWEKEPETVEHLFRDILFADSQGNVDTVQENMDRFLSEYEELRQKYFPANWSFKQERHSASVFLAMNDPDLNYVFKASEAKTMAKYIDFNLPIGSGANFSLVNYYHLCEAIIEALREHQSLLEKHFGRLGNEHYRDRSLHLLAFDLMYCCHYYGFYQGIPIPSAKKQAKQVTAMHRSPEELARLQAERDARVKEIEEAIAKLERECDPFEEISLIGVQVTSEKYGIGTVIDQKINLVKVQFAELQKSFLLHEKFASHPKFENDEFIIFKFTEYAKKQEQIQELQKELATL